LPEPLHLQNVWPEQIGPAGVDRNSTAVDGQQVVKSKGVVNQAAGAIKQGGVGKAFDNARLKAEVAVQK
jgi:hypothetical protein